MTPLAYILAGKLPVVCTDFLEWGYWFATADRTVGDTIVAEGFRVSTVFLGIDHGHGSETPLLFETMVFSLDTDDEAWAIGCDLQHRYSNWNDAEKGHAATVSYLESWIASLTDPKTRPITPTSETNQGDTL